MSIQIIRRSIINNADRFQYHNTSSKKVRSLDSLVVAFSLELRLVTSSALLSRKTEVAADWHELLLAQHIV